MDAISRHRAASRARRCARFAHGDGFWRGGPQGSDTTGQSPSWCPIPRCSCCSWCTRSRYGLWLGHHPSSYAQLFADPIYLHTVVNTLIFLAIGVNLHLFGALMLSGFFMRRNWRVRSLLLVYILPWAVPAIPTFIAIHWMLNGEWGFINNVLYDLFRHQRPVLAELPLAGPGVRRSSPISGNGCRSGR